MAKSYDYLKALDIINDLKKEDFSFDFDSKRVDIIINKKYSLRNILDKAASKFSMIVDYVEIRKVDEDSVLLFNEYIAYWRIIEIILSNYTLYIDSEDKNISAFMDKIKYHIYDENYILEILTFIYLLDPNYYKYVNWKLLLIFYNQVREMVKRNDDGTSNIYELRLKKYHLERMDLTENPQIKRNLTKYLTF